ncbi:MAG TPA: glycosyltransferase family 4 protein [Pyrinomonadaceae bacterium]|nr:glycosyltransferase family 4 protein [Pyrinomonadaceae bacterium]
MKILRIIARLNVGGPARHVVWLTDGLRAKGYDTMLVTGVVPPGEDDMTYFARSAGVIPHVIPQMSREISLRDALASWKIFRLMLRERPDLVHTHTAKAGTVGRVAGLLYRWLTPAALIGKPRACRFVHTYHGHVFHSYYGPAKTKLFLTIERALARLVTDRIIVVSEQQRREINEQFRVGRPEQFVVIPLGLDLSVFENWQLRRSVLRTELSIDDNALLIGIVGRLTEIKNHDFFLRVAKKLKESDLSRHSLRFLIIGDGKMRPQLEAAAEKFEISDDVIFLGTRNDPENFYPALDVVALTSHNEGTPLTLIEAMACARPVIATAVGGVVDLLGARLTDGDGYTLCERGLSVESGDVEGFAEGLNRLVRDDGLRKELGRRGGEFVVRNYAKERLIDDISNLYEQLLQAKAA